MKMYGGSGDITPSFFTSALDGVVRFKPRTHYLPDKKPAGWATEQVRTFWRREKPYACRESNPSSPARSPSLYWLSMKAGQSYFIISLAYITLLINRGFIRSCLNVYNTKPQ
jgi:hypothetical protein